MQKRMNFCPLLGLAMAVCLLGMAGAGRAQTVRGQDTFADTAGTLLQNHTPTGSVPGTSWTNLQTNNLQISPSGFIVQSGSTPAYYGMTFTNALSSKFWTVRQTFTFRTSTATGYGIGAFNSSVTSGTAGFYAQYSVSGTSGTSNSLYIGAIKSTGDASAFYTTASQSFPLTMTAGTQYMIELRRVNHGDGTGDLSVWIGSVSGGTSGMVQYGVTVNDGNTALAAPNMVFLSGQQAASSAVSAPVNAIQIQEPGSAVVQPLFGTPAVASVTTTTATFTSTAATGGTAPYSYQLYRSTVSGFVPASANAVGAATSTAPSADSGLLPGIPYYWRIVVTDSTSPTPYTVTSPQFGGATPAKNLVVGMQGDSLTVNYKASAPATTGASALLVSRLSKALGWNIALNNQGVSSAASGDWLPTSTTQESTPTLAGGGGMGTNGSGAVSTNIYNQCKAGFLSTGVNLIQIMLGTNDSKTANAVSAAAYQANIAALVAQDKTDFPGVPIVLIPPPYVTPGAYSQWTEASDVLLQAYAGVLVTVAANAGGGVTVGKSPFPFSLNNASDFADGVHFNDAGYSDLAAVWYASDLPVLAPTLTPKRRLQ